MRRRRAGSEGSPWLDELRREVGIARTVEGGFKALGRFSPGLHPAAAVRGPGVPGWPALYERFTVTYPGGTFIESFYGDGAISP